MSSELVSSNPNLAQGLVLRGLAQLAQGQQQLAEERYKVFVFLLLCICVFNLDSPLFYTYYICMVQKVLVLSERF